MAGLIFELSARVGLWALAQQGLVYHAMDVLHPADISSLERMMATSPGYLVIDPDLGWTIRPRGSWPGRAEATYDGLRLPSADTATVAAFGDSYTHGDGVRDDETWAAKLGVRNYGVSGYGVDQAYLRYLREGRERYRRILIGYMSENVRRTMNTFRPFYLPGGGPPWGKPRFTLQGPTLALQPNPLPTPGHYRTVLDSPSAALARVGVHDLYWQRGARASPWDRIAAVRLAKLTAYQLRLPVWYDPAGEPFRLAVAILDAFAAAATEDGSDAVILLFPRQRDLGRPPYIGLRDTLRARGHTVLDLRAAFAGCGRCASAFAADGHYSIAGHRLVAEYLSHQLP